MNKMIFIKDKTDVDVSAGEESEEHHQDHSKQKVDEKTTSGKSTILQVNIIAKITKDLDKQGTG